MPLIETKALCQRRDNRDILRKIDLRIEPGEVFTLIGPTGAGKTTLMRILDLLDPPTAGQLFFDGVEVASPAFDRLGVRRRMSYVQQRPLVFTMNVYDNVALALRWRHVKPADERQKTEEALEMVGMADFKTRNARTLSGGEMQRVAIARALVTKPEVLFLDEPTANMDPVSAAKIEEVLGHIIKEQKMTIVMATHNMSQGQRIASRMGVLINGELLQTGSVTGIFHQPNNREVAEFVGAENIIPGVVEKKDNQLALVTVNSEKILAVSDCGVGEPVYVLIRPEIIIFSSTGSSGSARNVFSCKVTGINTVGSIVRIEAECGFSLHGVITTQAAGELGISIGKDIYASFKATAVHVIRRWN